MTDQLHRPEDGHGDQEGTERGQRHDSADARASLARLWWFRRDQTDRLTGSTDRLASSLARRRILSEDDTDSVALETLFRGTAPGTQVGPYLSQFLLSATWTSTAATRPTP